MTTLVNVNRAYLVAGLVLLVGCLVLNAVVLVVVLQGRSQRDATTDPEIGFLLAVFNSTTQRHFADLGLQLQLQTGIVVSSLAAFNATLLQQFADVRQTNPTQQLDSKILSALAAFDSTTQRHFTDLGQQLRNQSDIVGASLAAFNATMQKQLADFWQRLNATQQQSQPSAWPEITESPTCIAGGTGPGILPNQLFHPVGLSVVSNGDVVVASAGAHAVVRFFRGGGTQYLTTSYPVAGRVGENSSALDHLYGPEFIFALPNGDLYVADHGNRRIMFWPKGSLTGIVAARLSGRPLGIAVSNDGVIFATDYDNHALLRFRSDPDSGTVVAGGNGAGPQLNQLRTPHNVRLHGLHAYVADAGNHRIIRFLADGTAPQAGVVVAGGLGAGAGWMQLNTPADLWLTPAGDMVVADALNHRVLLFKNAVTTTTGVEPSVLLGGNGAGNYINQLNTCYGLYVTNDKVVFVTELSGHRVIARRCPELA
eukprot:TRINITY_DN2261_c0_g1_i2.p1 TRINITY_DN2261_c0_g1~~TRINITY_DN2261_c0_g1_i2.p1  ORF type:complete len:489 (+),score=99.30 TRINITY_DN2261_c0_g1_i2:24-1469(+)